VIENGEGKRIGKGQRSKKGGTEEEETELKKNEGPIGRKKRNNAKEDLFGPPYKKKGATSPISVLGEPERIKKGR